MPSNFAQRWPGFVNYLRRRNQPPMPARIKRLTLRLHYLSPKTGVNALSNNGITMATASLTWTVPTLRTDGTPLAPTEVAGADVYDTASTTPTVPIGSVTGALGGFVTGLLAVGPHVFTVVTRDTTGHASAPSNAVSVTVPPTLANPAAVSDLAAVLQ
jgi:hypothetical protein